MKLTKWFKINGEDYEFMYLCSAKTKAALKPLVEFVKAQGDMYRITRHFGKYVIWDARR